MCQIIAICCSTKPIGYTFMADYSLSFPSFQVFCSVRKSGHQGHNALRRNRTHAYESIVAHSLPTSVQNGQLHLKWTHYLANDLRCQQLFGRMNCTQCMHACKLLNLISRRLFIIVDNHTWSQASLVELHSLSVEQNHASRRD